MADVIRPPANLVAGSEATYRASILAADGSSFPALENDGAIFREYSRLLFTIGILSGTGNYQIQAYFYSAKLGLWVPKQEEVATNTGSMLEIKSFFRPVAIKIISMIPDAGVTNFKLGISVQPVV